MVNLNKVWKIVGYILSGISMLLGLTFLITYILGYSVECSPLTVAFSNFALGFAVFCIAYTSNDVDNFDIDLSALSLIESPEDEAVTYLDFGENIRLIFRDGQYDGWYECGKEETAENGEVKY